MARIHKLTKNGQAICPATRMDAVVHPDLKVAASELIGEVNVSKIYPTGGTDGTDKYTLEAAVAKIPESLRSVGIKCSFLNDTGELETWVYAYKAGGWQSRNFVQVGSAGLVNRGTRFLSWNTDADTTRQQVPVKERKKGMLVLYRHPTNGYVVEQSIIEDDSQVGDSRYWGKDKNWQRLLVDADYNELAKLGKDYFYAQNDAINHIILPGVGLIASDGTLSTASNNLQKIWAFTVSDYNSIYIDIEANNYYAPFYAYAFSDKDIDELSVGTSTLAEQRPSLTPENTDFSFSGLLARPTNAKTLLVQFTNGKGDKIKVFSILKEKVNAFNSQIEAISPMGLKDITENLIWRNGAYIRNDTQTNSGDAYKHSILSYAVPYDRIKAELPDGYNIRVRSRYNNPKLLSSNPNGEYLLNDDNKYVEVNIYLTDNEQTLTVEKMIADGVKLYGVQTVDNTVDLGIMQRRVLQPTWMGYSGYTITNGTIVKVASGRAYCRIFGVRVKAGRYYRVKFNGYGCIFEPWASYAFFASDYKTGTAIDYDNIPAGLYIQIDVVKKAPTGAEFLMLCLSTGANDMLSGCADVVVEECTDVQSAITLANSQNIPQSMYNAGVSDVLSKSKDVGIIVAGQSNTAGRCPADDIPAGIVNDAGQIPYCNLQGTLSINGKATDDNIFNGIYTLQSVWAFDAIVYKKLSDKLQKKFYVAKYAIGDTAIIDYSGTTQPCWQPDTNKITTPGKASLTLKLRETIESVLASHENVEFKAVLWHQGEGDMQCVEGAFDYYENFKAVIWYIRGIVGNPNLPFIFGTISHKSMQYSAMIEDAQKRVADEDPNVYYVDMAEAELLDDYHFNAAYSEYLGNEIWNILEPLIDASVEK